MDYSPGAAFRHDKLPSEVAPSISHLSHKLKRTLEGIAHPALFPSLHVCEHRTSISTSIIGATHTYENACSFAGSQGTQAGVGAIGNERIGEQEG